MFLELRDADGLMAGSLRDAGAARCLGLEVRSESGAGDNWGSTFLKVDIHYEREDAAALKVPAVCKMLPPTEYLRDTFNVAVSFPKEVNFYRHVVPALEAFQSELAVPEAERLRVFPKLLGSRIGATDDRVDEEAILVLEDLSVSGYSCGNRSIGLDLAHCRLAIRDLARLHALGIALKRSRPQVFWGPVKEACVLYLHNKPQAVRDRILTGLQTGSLNLVLEAMPELLELVDGDRLRRAVVQGMEPSEPQEPFCTLTHCDFWLNNMMFAYGGADDPAAPARLKMVDFQLTQVGSPARDLLFFVYSSADSSALAEADSLLREYHAELVRYAALHGADTAGLGWDSFREEMDRVASQVLSQLFVMVAVIRAENAIAREDSTSEEVFSSGLGVSQGARTRYSEVVADWVRRAWL